MRGVVSARCPHKKDDPCAPHAKALKPQFAVVKASAEIASPRSASAMDSSRSASSSGGTSNISSASRGRIVATVPSWRGSPSTMTFPPTTVPVAGCMDGYYAAVRGQDTDAEHAADYHE